MKLFKYYKKAVLYPSAFILFFTTVYSVFDFLIREWVSLKSEFWMMIVPVFIFSTLMCILALPIFFNKIKKFNSNLIWNVLTWFFIPLLYLILILIQDFSNRVKYEFGFGNDFLYLLILTIPYVIGLVRTFIEYRKIITNKNTDSSKIQAVVV